MTSDKASPYLRNRYMHGAPHQGMPHEPSFRESYAIYATVMDALACEVPWPQFAGYVRASR